mgnify:CR=1 FL=1
MAVAPIQGEPPKIVEINRRGPAHTERPPDLQALAKEGFRSLLIAFVNGDGREETEGEVSAPEVALALGDCQALGSCRLAPADVPHSRVVLERRRRCHSNDVRPRAAAPRRDKEIIATLVASIGLIAAVPITTALAAALALGEAPERLPEEAHQH